MAKTSQNQMNIYESEDGYADTWGIGGDRFALYAESAFDPQPYVGTTTPVPLALLSIPPSYSELDSVAGQYGSTGQTSAAAAGAPFSFVHSPTPYIIVGLIVGFVALHKLYFSKKKK